MEVWLVLLGWGEVLVWKDLTGKLSFELNLEIRGGGERTFQSREEREQRVKGLDELGLSREFRVQNILQEVCLSYVKNNDCRY